MDTIAVSNGDLVINEVGTATRVTGRAKLIQDLAIFFNSPYDNLRNYKTKLNEVVHLGRSAVLVEADDAMTRFMTYQRLVDTPASEFVVSHAILDAIIGRDMYIVIQINTKDGKQTTEEIPILLPQ